MTTVIDKSPDHTAVIFEANYPKLTPQQLFDFFTKPELLVTWWPQEAEINLEEAESYALHWPSMEWTLRGVYTAVSPPHHLAFTWQWDHLLDLPTRLVDIKIEQKGNGSLLTLRHGTYTKSQVDQEDRQNHVDGWLHFLPQIDAANLSKIYEGE